MYVQLLKKAFHAWRDDHVPRLAAALSYYTLFSLAPLFLIIISLASVFFGEDRIRSHILTQIGTLIGPNGAQALSMFIQRNPPVSENVLLSTLGTIIIFIGATGVFGQLKSSLDFIWKVQPKKERNILTFLEHNFLPFTMVLGTGFLLLVSLVLTSFIIALSNNLTAFLPFHISILQSINLLVAVVVITGLFALIYKFLPDEKVEWGDVWSGSVVAAVLFTIGKFVIGFYIGNSNILSAYGAAGSIVVILLWVYYSAQILFYGAEFTKVYAYEYGSKKKKEPEISTSARVIGAFLKGFVDGILKKI